MLHLIVLDAYNPYVYLSFDLRITPNDEVKADSASLFRPAGSLHFALKAAASTENIGTSVTDRARC